MDIDNYLTVCSDFTAALFLPMCFYPINFAHINRSESTFLAFNKQKNQNKDLSLWPLS